MTPGTFSPPPRPSSTPWQTQQTTFTNGASGPEPRSRRPGTLPHWPMSGRWKKAYPSPGSMSTTPAQRSTRPRPSITWHGDLIRSYAVQAASEKITRLANQTITMLREKTGEGGQKEDGSIAARAVIARMGKAELRTDATKREQVIDLLVTHRHLIPVARKGHYMMMVPHV